MLGRYRKISPPANASLKGIISSPVFKIFTDFHGNRELLQTFARVRSGWKIVKNWKINSAFVNPPLVTISNYIVLICDEYFKDEPRRENFLTNNNKIPQACWACWHYFFQRGSPTSNECDFHCCSLHAGGGGTEGHRVTSAPGPAGTTGQVSSPTVECSVAGVGEVALTQSHTQSVTGIATTRAISS